LNFKINVALVVIVIAGFGTALFFIPTNAQTSKVGQLPSYLQEVVNEKTYIDFNERAANQVKFFRGEDWSGVRIIEVLAALKTTEYSIEGMVSPTDYGWYTIKNFINEEEVYTVGYILNTPEGTQEFIWEYNRDTGNVSALNESAQKIIDIVNKYD